jgi:Ca-activated chloride channel family protein
MTGLSFLHPWMLLLGLLVPIAMLWRARRGAPAVRFAPAAFVEDLPKTWRIRLLPLPRVLEAAALLLAIVALARPVERAPLPQKSEGIDVMLLLDTSSSMAARDLDPSRTRLDVAKDAAAQFVGRRPHDRIGLVRFARYPDLVCPLTLDHGSAGNLLSEIKLVEADGPEDATGIGAAVAFAAKVLRNGASRSKVAILLTDGEENVATALTPKEIAPIHAAQLSRELGVRVYAIAVGSPDRGAPDGRLTVDTTQIRLVAEKCDGAFFQAPDAASLASVYDRIDELERAPLEEPRFRIEERFLAFLAVALAMLLGSRLLESTVLEVLP